MIPPFLLRTFFNDDEALAARGTISGSYSELATVESLLALEPGAADAYLRVPLGYAALNGGEELRTLIAAHLGALAADHVIVTAGSDDAIALLMLALLQGGEHIIAHAPAYQPLTDLAAWRGAEVTPWEAEEAHGWALSLDRLSALIRPTTRLLIVNFPHNPTGWCPDPSFVHGLVTIAELHGLLILSDEVYAGLALTDGEPFHPLASLTPRAISLGSLTKVFGMPGVRIGWLATRNAEVLAQVRHFRMYLNAYATTPGEFLACLALRHADAILARNTAIARGNLALLDDFITARSVLFSWQRPVGGTICFPRWLGPGDTTQLGRAFLQQSGYLLATSEHLVAGTRHMRLGFGTSGLPRQLAAFQEFVDHYAITAYLED